MGSALGQLDPCEEEAGGRSRMGVSAWPAHNTSSHLGWVSIALVFTDLQMKMGPHTQVVFWFASPEKSVHCLLV